jgi:nicotinamide-nucleotide amidase
MDTRRIAEAAQLVAHALTTRGERIAVAESCTGGWIAKSLTDIAGSSAWFDCGWVCYSDTAKSSQLGVDPSVIATHGAVSEQTAAALAAGARTRSGADVALAVSGIAGPGGGSAAKPVGMVCFAWADRDGVRTATQQFVGDRESVRAQAVVVALQGVLRHDLSQDCGITPQ